MLNVAVRWMTAMDDSFICPISLTWHWSTRRVLLLGETVEIPISLFLRSLMESLKNLVEAVSSNELTKPECKTKQTSTTTTKKMDCSVECMIRGCRNIACRSVFVYYLFDIQCVSFYSLIHKEFPRILLFVEIEKFFSVQSLLDIKEFLSDFPSPCPIIIVVLS